MSGLKLRTDSMYTQTNTVNPIKVRDLVSKQQIFYFDSILNIL